LVGCKTDLRTDSKTVDELQKISQKPVSFEEGTTAASNIGARKYMECSAKTDEGVQEVFQHATRLAYKYGVILNKSKRGSNCICI
jgi:Ras family protein A